MFPFAGDGAVPGAGRSLVPRLNSAGFASPERCEEGVFSWQERAYREEKHLFTKFCCLRYKRCSGVKPKFVTDVG